jgi:hypothetical protein
MSQKRDKSMITRRYRGGREVNEYKITFEIFGVKRRLTIKADTKGEALSKLRRKIWSVVKIIDVEETPDTLDYLKNIFGMRD